jgi:plasmid stabilization system protein ParE
MNVKLLTPAQDELDEAVAWYASQAPGLGDAFLAETLKTLELITQHPLAWHRLSLQTRRCRLRRFPYSVVYIPMVDEILVIAIAHQRREPAYWLERFQSSGGQA